MGRLLSLSLVLFLVSCVPSHAQSTVSSDDGAGAPSTVVPDSAPESVVTIPLNLFAYDVGRAFTLNCSLKYLDGTQKILWAKNGTDIDKVADLRDRYTIGANGELRLTTRTTEDDFGNYTCGVGESKHAFGWEVVGRPYAKLPTDTNVVEGQKLKLVCRLVGKPYPSVEWTYRNATANTTDLVAAFGEDRVKLTASDQGVAGAVLTIDPARREDAGDYICTPMGGLPFKTTVRVKDMYAALWPFLGICAEVFVLCAIILLYEKRRTKPDLDDSDTDNHDQKKS